MTHTTFANVFGRFQDLHNADAISLRSYISDGMNSTVLGSYISYLRDPVLVPGLNYSDRPIVFLTPEADMSHYIRYRSKIKRVCSIYSNEKNEFTSLPNSKSRRQSESPTKVQELDTCHPHSIQTMTSLHSLSYVHLSKPSKNVVIARPMASATFWKI